MCTASQRPYHLPKRVLHHSIEKNHHRTGIWWIAERKSTHRQLLHAPHVMSSFKSTARRKLFDCSGMPWFLHTTHMWFNDLIFFYAVWLFYICNNFTSSHSFSDTISTDKLKFNVWAACFIFICLLVTIMNLTYQINRHFWIKHFIIPGHIFRK